jgi:hypothetical protein
MIFCNLYAIIQKNLFQSSVALKKVFCKAYGKLLANGINDKGAAISNHRIIIRD